MIITPFAPSIAPLLAQADDQQIFVLADSHTCSLIPSLGLERYPMCVLEAGEEHKSIAGLQQVWQFLLDHQASRQAILVNVGGGVITDLGGLAAATWKRGIRFIQVPTTLLSMVDAAIGGKTGINFGGIKNSIGTFTSPLETLIYPPVLTSLPAKEWLSGWGEVIKTALLSGEPLWHQVQAFDLHQPQKDITPIITACLHYKEQIVTQDPHEANRRQVLNFGHTIGHALEQQTHAPHGYAVVWGMVAELYLSVIHAGCDKQLLTALSHIMVEYYGRPQCDCKEGERLLESMRQDKKNPAPNQIRFTLLHAVGQPQYGITVPEEAIREALDYLFSI